MTDPTPLPVLFRTAGGLIWDASAIGYKRLLGALNRMPDCNVRSKANAWWADDWAIEFEFRGVTIRADTPLSDAMLHYPDSASRIVLEDLERQLCGLLPAALREGPPPLDRSQWTHSDR